MTIETILTPDGIARLPQRQLDDACCVVFDVLRATSSIVTAFAHGAAAVKPVPTIDAARREAAAAPLLLAGERGGDRIPGFDLGNSPGEFTACAGRRIVTTTTNGTVALDACAGAAHVAAGCLLNLDSLAAVVRGWHPERLLLVCAGTHERCALEDVYAAGLLIAALAVDPAPDDASVLAEASAARWRGEHEQALRQAENGRALVDAGRAADIRWAARRSVYAQVPQRSRDGWLTV